MESVLWFCAFFFIFFIFFIFVYSQGSEGLTIWGVVWFLFEVGDYWPFVLQCPGSPFAFYIPLMGALIK